MEGEVSAFHNERLRELAAKKNTTVLTVTHDNVHEPWSVERLRAVLEPLVERALAAGDDVSDFALRKSLLEDPEVLAFQREHPKFYWLLTDRAVMRDARSRKAITGMLYVRGQVESGAVPAGQEADAMATKTVLAALQEEQ